MRNLRFFGVLAGGIVALLCAVLLGVWLFVNPNHYKGRIAAAVKEATGRDLQLSGDIKLSVIPWVALELGPASLGNPPGFGAEPLLSFSRASIRVKLLPLLRQHLQVARVEIDGLDLRLRKNAQGRGNWQDAEPGAKPAKAGVDHRGAGALESLGNIRLKAGRISYAGITIDKLNLETGSLAADRHIPVNLTFAANRASLGDELTMSAKFDLSQDAEQSQLLIRAVTLSGTAGRQGDGRPAHWELSTPVVTVNVAQQSVVAPEFVMSYSSARLTGGVEAQKFIDDLSLAARLTLAPVLLREFAPRLGISLPRTRDPNAWSTLSAVTDFTYDSKAMRLNHLQLHVDDTTVQGNITLLAGDSQQLKFDLAADHIDLDRYRAADAGGATPESTSPESPKRGAPWDANGTLSVKSAQFARLDLADVKVTLAAKDSVTHLSPIEGQVDAGRFVGDITWDSRGATSRLSIDEQLTGVDMVRLLAGTGGKGRLSGRATLNLKATAHGADADAMLKTLSGHLDANLADGALEGIDVQYELNLAQALIKRAPAPQGGSTGRTPFQAFKLSAQITNGIAQTKDLTIASQALKVTGQGTANASTKAIDFKLLASILTAPAQNTDIPLTVTGTYVNPSVKPDIEALAKDQLKQKLQDVLKKNGLQGLFSK